MRAARAVPFRSAHGSDRGGAKAYVRRPEESVLYGVVQAELETFLARAAARGGRRMADTATHLVDRVLPVVPVRQWVLSLPFALRYRLVYDAGLTSAVLGLFVRTVFASLRRRARRRWGVPRGHCGASPSCSDNGSALDLNVHFHSLLPDGVYAPGPGGTLRFHPLPPPGDAEVERVVGQVARRLERLCRYAARPPVATERLSRLADGRLLDRLKHRWRDGTTPVVFEPQELLEKLEALVPPPRFHLVRYHGILGPCAGERDRVVPGSVAAQARARPRPPEASGDRPGGPPSNASGQDQGRIPTP